jgi:hypothetical protein
MDRKFTGQQNRDELETQCEHLLTDKVAGTWWHTCYIMLYRSDLDRTNERDLFL